MSVTETGAGGGSTRESRHVSFLAYDGFRYLKIAAAAAVAALVIYIADRPYGSRFGGSIAGYILGSVGALLIVWLTFFGYRKRNYTSSAAGVVRDGRPVEDAGRLARWLSAHVYLGSVLLIIATLHTGFSFGWNIHTLAYALMCIVIVSGIFGVFTYVHYPRLITQNREGMTMQAMLGRVASINEDMSVKARPLDNVSGALVEASIRNTAIGGSTWRQLSGRYPDCATARAIESMRARSDVPPLMQDTWRDVRLALDEKAALLDRLRRDISYKALMEIWLYFHVPVSFALLAALLAHIIAIFFLW